MAGTRAGAAKARATNLERYGAGFYKTIGTAGGSQSGKYKGRGGFAKDRELAKRAGRLGGQHRWINREDT